MKAWLRKILILLFLSVPNLVWAIQIDESLRYPPTYEEQMARQLQFDLFLLSIVGIIGLLAIACTLLENRETSEQKPEKE